MIPAVAIPESERGEPTDPEQRMQYAWSKLERLTIDLAKKNGTDLQHLKNRIRLASTNSIRILEQARERQ